LPVEITKDCLMTKTLALCLIGLLTSAAAQADSSGSDWGSSYTFTSPSKQQTNMSQADLIAKKESGYYNGLGKTEIYNISTTAIGTMTTTNNTVNGNSNNVAADSVSSGSLDASVKIQSLVSSALTQNKSY
jgi:hypothetical protein